MAQFFGLIPLNAANFESGSATNGQVLSADGSGGASWETASGGGGVTDVTYADLVTLIGASGLTAGQQYRITDYATTHYIVDGDGNQYTTGDGIIVGTTEPLIVTAVSANNLYVEAKSELFPADVIHYDWNPNNWLSNYHFAVDEMTIITGWKGVIISRHDTILNIDAPADWRNCKTRRWETAAPAWVGTTNYDANSIVGHAGTSKIYCSLVNNNLNNEPAGVDDAYWVVLLDLSNFTYWNSSPSKWNDIPSGATYSDFLLFYDFSGCYSIKIDGDYQLLTDSVFFSYVINNLDAKSGFTNNTIGSGFTNNTIGSGFSGNMIDSNFTNNTIGSSSYSNTIGSDSSYNTIGSSFYNNKISSGFSYNKFGAGCDSNIIGSNFSYNIIGAYFYSNIIGSGFNSNEVSNESCSGVDFSSATHVYGAYNCYIYKRLDGTKKLRYFDNSDVQQVVAVTA